MRLERKLKNSLHVHSFAIKVIHKLIEEHDGAPSRLAQKLLLMQSMVQYSCCFASQVTLVLSKAHHTLHTSSPQCCEKEASLKYSVPGEGLHTWHTCQRPLVCLTSAPSKN